MKRIILLFIFFALTSCKYLYLKKMGVTKPKIETVQTIEKYLKKQNINSENLMFAKNSESFDSLRKLHITIQDAYFFNKKGYFVPYKKDANECRGQLEPFIADLKNFDKKPIDTTLTISKLNNLIVDKNNNPLPLNQFNNKIITVLPFAKYAGRINDKYTFDWIDVIDKVKKENKLPIVVILLDLDILKSWNVDQIHSKLLLE